MVENLLVPLSGRVKCSFVVENLLVSLSGRVDNLRYTASSLRSLMLDSLSYFLYQLVLHNKCNKDCGMYYPVCGVMHIKYPLL